MRNCRVESSTSTGDSNHVVQRFQIVDASFYKPILARTVLFKVVAIIFFVFPEFIILSVHTGKQYKN